MKYLESDLLGHRCPDVAQKILKTLRILVDSEFQYAVVTTLEPSAYRDLKTAIELQFSGILELSERLVRPLTNQRKQLILSAPEGFDDDDLLEVSEETVFLISKVKSS